MPARALVVYGTETGTAKQSISKIAKSLGAAGSIEVVATKDGNSVGSLEALKESYDVILVATSSYGEGDPPGNYGRFLANLLKAANDGSQPLAGMQHAVLGFGSSVYETYQNCPRLSDKLLGECGSTRIAKRIEIDDCGSDEREGQTKEWEAAVSKSLKKPVGKPVCDWTEPASDILEKTESDLLMFADSEGGAGGAGMAFGAVAVVAAAVGAYYSGFFG